MDSTFKRTSNYFKPSNSCDRCVHIHVPSIPEIINMFTSTGQLPPAVRMQAAFKNNVDEDFNTDISLRNPRQMEIPNLYNNLQRINENVREEIRILNSRKNESGNQPPVTTPVEQ